MKNLLTLLFILIVSFTYGQTRQISGIVYNNSTNKPISEVNITVNGTSIVTTTNNLGEFLLNVPDTLISLEFSGFPGMHLSEIKIVEADVYHLYLSIEEDDLFNLSLEELMNIPVTSASKFAESVNETPATVFVITASDIRRRGYLTMIELLEDLPGMDIANSNGEVNILTYGRGNRTGSMNERLMLMVDGIEHNILYSQQMMISQDFPLGVIQRVEILYGPSSAVYGPNAFSGVINVITKKTSSIENFDQVNITTAAGSFNTQLGEVAYRAKYGDLGLSVAYRRFRSDRFDMSKSPGYFAEGTIIGNPNIWGPYAEQYNKFDNKADNHSIFTKLSFRNFEVGFNRLSTKQGNGAAYPYDKTLPTTNWHLFRNIAYGRYGKNVTNKFYFSTLAVIQRGGSNPDAVWAQGWNAGDTWDTERTVEMMTWKYISDRWSIFQDFVYKPTKNFTVSGGVKYASTTYQKSYEFGRSDQTTWLPGTNWEEVENLYPNPYNAFHNPGNTFDDYEWGVYSQMKFSVLDGNMNFVAGARYDDNSIYGDVFNPRVGMTFLLANNFWIKANYGTAFQAPAPRNLYGSWGGLTVNENLEPEKIRAFDGSLIFTSKNARADATLFYNTVTNSVLQGENLPEKNMIGVELKTDFFISEISSQMSQVRLHFNVSYIDASYEAERFDATTNRSSSTIGDIAPIKFNVIASCLLFEKVGLFVRGNYVSKRTTVVTNPVENINSYFTLNAGVQLEKLFGFEGATLFLNAYNLLNAEYYHPGWDAASAGEDISKPSAGWYSSRLQQAPFNVMAGIHFTF